MRDTQACVGEMCSGRRSATCLSMITDRCGSVDDGNVYQVSFSSLSHCARARHTSESRRLPGKVLSLFSFFSNTHIEIVVLADAWSQLQWKLALAEVILCLWTCHICYLMKTDGIDQDAAASSIHTPRAKRVQQIIARSLFHIDHRGSAWREL